MQLVSSIRSFIAKQVDQHLDDAKKRLVVLSSLSALTAKKQSFNDHTLQKLNTLMNLGGDPKALRLPSMMTRAVWYGDKGVEIMKCTEGICTLEDRDRAVDRILSFVPECLRYGENNEQLKEDITKLLDNREAITA